MTQNAVTLGLTAVLGALLCASAASAQGLPAPKRHIPYPIPHPIPQPRAAAEQVSITFFNGDGPWRNSTRLTVDLETGVATLWQTGHVIRPIGKTKLDRAEVKQIQALIAQAGLGTPSYPRPFPFPLHQGPLHKLARSMDDVEQIQPSAEQAKGLWRKTPHRPSFSLSVDFGGYETTVRGGSRIFLQNPALGRLVSELRGVAAEAKRPVKPWPKLPRPPFDLIRDRLEDLVGLGSRLALPHLPGGPLVGPILGKVHEAFERQRAAAKLGKYLAKKQAEKAAEAAKKGASIAEGVKDAAEEAVKKVAEGAVKGIDETRKRVGMVGGLNVR